MHIFVTSAEEATTRTGSNYLRIRYVAEDKIPQTAVMFDTNIKPVTINGQVLDATIIQGAPSNKIDKFTVIENADKAPFIRITKFPVATMLEDLKKWTRGDGVDQNLTKIVDHVLFGAKGRPERFSEWPAATTNHHAFQGGLLEHTWAMAKSAVALLKEDPALVGLDAGVVMAAVALHDVAKIFTYDFQAGQGGNGEKNNFEVLLGHIVIADEVVVKACVAENITTTKGCVLNLRHCMLSHHGKKDWGSPIIPSTREAIFLHQLDMMQSRNEMAMEATEGVEKGKRSSFVRPLEAEIVNQ